MVVPGWIVFEHDQGVRARAGRRFTSGQGPADRAIAGIVEYQVRVAAGPLQPLLNAPAVLRDSGADRMLGRCAIRVRRCSRDIRLLSQTLAELMVRLANV